MQNWFMLLVLSLADKENLTDRQAEGFNSYILFEHSGPQKKKANKNSLPKISDQ